MPNRSLLFALALFLPSSAAFAETWASLKGRFVFEGDIPKQKTFALSASQRAAHGLPADFRFTDDRMQVDEESKGIANILVYVAHERTDSKLKMPVFNDPRDTPNPEHLFHFQNLSYSPRISFMYTTQKLLFVNAHATPMIVTYQEPAEKRVRLRFDPNGRVPRSFWKPTPTPIHIDHAINGALDAWVLVRDNPYVALTNSKGEFEIKNLPVGNWQFVAWHEKAQEKLTVNRDGKEETWKKGEFLATIEKKGTDLGEIKVAESNFRK
jgi:hypothetical protein